MGQNDTLTCMWTLQVPNPTCLGSTCSFNTSYGGSTLAANLSQETFTLATDAVPGYTFGCLQKTTGNSVPPQGLLGLGRGPLSLLSQTQNLYQSTFSYCLPSFKSLNFSGSLRLGPVGQPKRIKYTPLLKNPRRSSLYYVNLNAIRVGRRIVDIPPAALAFNPTTGAGTIIDSGNTLKFCSYKNFGHECYFGPLLRMWSRHRVEFKCTFSVIMWLAHMSTGPLLDLDLVLTLETKLPLLKL